MDIFYKPRGSEPPYLIGDPFRHPETKQQIFNPSPDPVLRFFVLEFKVPQPDPRIWDSTPEYVMSSDGLWVRMSWDSKKKPIGKLYQARLAELRAEVMRRFTLTRDLGGVPAHSSFAVTALAHQARITSGDTDAQDEYQFLREDGEIATRSAAQVENFVQRLSKDANSDGDNYEAHKAALIVLRDAGDHLGVVTYDITTGWPS